MCTDWWDKHYVFDREFEHGQCCYKEMHLNLKAQTKSLNTQSSGKKDFSGYSCPRSHSSRISVPLIDFSEGKGSKRNSMGRHQEKKLWWKKEISYSLRDTALCL